MTDAIEDALHDVGDAVEGVTSAIEQNVRAAWEQGIEGRLAAVEGHTHDTEHTHAEFAGAEHTHDTAHEHGEYAATEHVHATAANSEAGDNGDGDDATGDVSQSTEAEIKPDRGSHEEREKVPHRTHFLFKRVGRR